MKILVIGASGLVGSHVLAEAVARGHEVVGTYRSFPIPNLVRLDLADVDQTRRFLEASKPDWVVHAAGWTWVDGCEKDPERAMRENYEQPVMLAQACRETGIRMAYFSTTYVFDGLEGPYSEEDVINPINVYGKTKALAEKKILNLLQNTALIPRTICVWGLEPQQKNFVYQTVKSLIAGRRCNLPADQYGNPTWAGDIASWLITLMQKNSVGIWNLAGDNEHCSRVTWYETIRHQLELQPDLSLSSYPEPQIYRTGEQNQVAPRPLNASACTKKRKRHSLIESSCDTIFPKLLQSCQKIAT